MKQMKTRRVLGMAIAITMVLLAVSAVPAMACSLELQEPIDINRTTEGHEGRTNFKFFCSVYNYQIRYQ
ncbi:MAG: hypothetical protein C5S48_08665 [Candidatus Methanogaster sp.]|nr:MAG: hypothetical protein C5S48_08665 [ANME-2 cluster archaeon]